MRKAFTLIELLVVVSIIALLIAILLPVLSNAKYAVRTTQCASRLKQMAIAATASAVDSDGYYPHKMANDATTFLNAIDGKVYRSELNPWQVRGSQSGGSNNFDYRPLLSPYVSDLADIFICPHADPIWDDGYGSSTNSQIISYAMYWGITRRGDTRGVEIPQTRLGEGFGPSTWLQMSGAFTQNSRYRFLGSDMVAWNRITGKILGNHPPTGGEYTEKSTGNASARGYEYEETTAGNANYVYDDGSVQLYGQIYLDTIGGDADDEFGYVNQSWLAPTDRVDK